MNKKVKNQQLDALVKIRLEKDVKEHMEVLKPGGRWIAGSSHSIVNYIPHENFAAMINAFHRYGMY